MVWECEISRKNFHGLLLSPSPFIIFVHWDNVQGKAMKWRKMKEEVVCIVEG